MEKRRGTNHTTEGKSGPIYVLRIFGTTAFQSPNASMKLPHACIWSEARDVGPDWSTPRLSQQGIPQRRILHADKLRLCTAERERVHRMSLPNPGTPPHSKHTPHGTITHLPFPLTLNEGSISSARRYASSPASGSPSCPRHRPIMFQSVLESTLDFTTSLKSTTARLKYRSCTQSKCGDRRQNTPFREDKRERAKCHLELNTKHTRWLSFGDGNGGRSTNITLCARTSGLMSPCTRFTFTPKTKFALNHLQHARRGRKPRKLSPCGTPCRVDAKRRGLCR